MIAVSPLLLLLLLLTFNQQAKRAAHLEPRSLRAPGHIQTLEWSASLIFNQCSFSSTRINLMSRIGICNFSTMATKTIGAACSFSAGCR